MFANSAIEEEDVVKQVARARVRSKLFQKGAIGLQNTFELMKELFADISRGNGTMTITAARGNQFANEGSQWGNGVFTHAVKKGLRTLEADLNEDGEITVNELSKYVRMKVEQLTHGKQQPTTRRELIGIDWVIW